METIWSLSISEISSPKREMDWDGKEIQNNKGQCDTGGNWENYQRNTYN